MDCHYLATIEAVHSYPILVNIFGTKKIVVAGIYLCEYGKVKMPPVDEFLTMFINDLNLIKENGLTMNGTLMPVKIMAFCCDAPARSDLKNIWNHNSYYSCERCVQKGKRVGGHVSMPKANSSLRTDGTFNLKTNEAHHLSNDETAMEKLGIGMVTQFSLDYMHCVLLGVTKKLLKRWKESSKGEKKRHLNSGLRDGFDTAIEYLSYYIPSDFSRRLGGGLNGAHNWKATEYRLFLVYIGILFDGGTILPSDLYKNYLKFAVAMRILLSDGQLENLPFAHALLVSFIKEAIHLYGPSIITYNWHCLTHLCEDYKKWGKLDNVSCFQFENFLGSYIKNALHGTNKVLQELSSYIELKNSEKITTNDIDSPIYGKKVPDKSNQNAYKSIAIKQTVIKYNNDPKDSGVLLKDGRIGIVQEIRLDGMKVNVYEDCGPFLQNPVIPRL
jgi:hypothetical protein